MVTNGTPGTLTIAADVTASRIVFMSPALRPSRWKRGMRHPSHWYCPRCLREFSGDRTGPLVIWHSCLGGEDGAA